MEPARPGRGPLDLDAQAILFGQAEVGKQLGKYQMLATIQRGGMGEVVLAETIGPPGETRLVVLKRLLADFLEDGRYVDMFRSEAEVMSQLNHPNIVKVLELPVLEGKQCIALEYVYGQNVSEILRRCKGLGVRMPPPVAMHIICEVLQGLDYVHNFVLEDGRPLNLIHRDVTPANVLISFEGQVKLTDFGISKSKLNAQETTVGIVKGTTRYLSPEQIQGRPASPRSDLFSCASVLIEMLSGEPLFERANVPATLFAITSNDRATVEKLLPFQAPLLSAVLERTLSLDPELRPRSAHDLRATLLAAMHEIGTGIESAALGSFVRDLFPEASEGPMAAFERSGSKESGFDTHDYTYLLELRSSLQRGDAGQLPILRSPHLERVRAAIAQLGDGRVPLDGEDFAAQPYEPEREPTDPYSVPDEEGSEAATVVPPPMPAPPPVPPLTPAPLDLEDIWSEGPSQPSAVLDAFSSTPQGTISSVEVVNEAAAPRPVGGTQDMRRDPVRADSPIAVAVPLAGPLSGPAELSSSLISAMAALEPPLQAAEIPLAAPPGGASPEAGSGPGRMYGGAQDVRRESGGASPEAGSGPGRMYGGAASPSVPLVVPVSASTLGRERRGRFGQVLRMIALFGAGAVFGTLVLSRYLPPPAGGPPEPTPAATVTVPAPAQVSAPPVEAAAAVEVAQPQPQAQAQAEAAPLPDPEAEASPENTADDAGKKGASHARKGTQATIDIRRPQGARVLIDGAPISKRAPIVGLRVSSGPHKITVIKGASKKVFSIHVEAGQHFELAH